MLQSAQIMQYLRDLRLNVYSRENPNVVIRDIESNGISFTFVEDDGHNSVIHHVRESDFIKYKRRKMQKIADTISDPEERFAFFIGECYCCGDDQPGLATYIHKNEGLCPLCVNEQELIESGEI